MDKPLDEVARCDTNAKLIYLTEMLRRKMFDHLPSTANHGYLQETGFGIKTGVLATLGGYNPHDAQNESYWLQIAANEALRAQYGTKKPPEDETPTIVYTDPYIDRGIAERIASVVHYADYPVETSIRGIEAMVSRYGREALVSFDQGSRYMTWVDAQKTNWKTKKEPKLSLEQTLPLLSAIYSYFQDCGGELLAEDLYGKRFPEQTDPTTMSINKLLTTLFPQPKKDGTLLFWHPRYVSKENRPKIKE